MHPGSRDEHSICLMDNAFALFGGYVGGRKCSNDLLLFEFEKKRWHYLEVADGYAPEPRAGSSIVCNGNNLIVFGGKDEEGNRLNDLWSFNL